MDSVDPYTLSKEELLLRVKELYRDVARKLNWPSTFSGVMNHIELLRAEINRSKNDTEGYTDSITNCNDEENQLVSENESHHNTLDSSNANSSIRNSMYYSAAEAKGKTEEQRNKTGVCIEDSLDISLYCKSPISVQDNETFVTTNNISLEKRKSKRRSVCLPQIIKSSDDDDDDDDDDDEEDDYDEDNNLGDDYEDESLNNKSDSNLETRDSDHVLDTTHTILSSTKLSSKKKSILQITSDQDDNSGDDIGNSGIDDEFEKSNDVEKVKSGQEKQKSKRRSVCLPQIIDSSDDEEDEDDNAYEMNDDENYNNESESLDYESAEEDRKSDRSDKEIGISDDDSVVQIKQNLLLPPDKDTSYEENDDAPDTSESEEDNLESFLSTVKQTSKGKPLSISLSDSESEADSDSETSDNDCAAHKTNNKENSNPTPAKYPVFKTPTIPSRAKSRVSVLSSIPTPRTPGTPNTPSYKQHYKKTRELAAKDLFTLFNQTVFDSQLPEDSAISWNKRLLSTAGYCCSFRGDDNTRKARIELSEKVCDRSERLRDTLIHEMCHAAAWIIDGKKDGHGPSWKKWAEKANSVHKDLLPIASCHKYDIVKKFTYRCLNASCSQTYGRHSKSINVETSSCSRCGSPLELLPPVNADGTPKKVRTPNKFALHVKENYTRLKNNGQGLKHSEIMKLLADSFRSYQNSK